MCTERSRVPGHAADGAALPVAPQRGADARVGGQEQPRAPRRHAATRAPATLAHAAQALHVSTAIQPLNCHKRLSFSN